MLAESHARIQPIFEKRDHGFRWRGRELSRIEGLSDAVFAFCVTLLVVSLEAPKTFAELSHMMHGFVSFGLCFLLLIMIWHTQYIYFRRYALDDTISFVLNAALLFVVAFYVYPLKFLMSLLVDMITGYRALDAAGNVIQVIQAGDWKSLMLIYNAGFITLYLIFALLYWHAYRQRERLALNAMESYETRGVIQENLLMAGIGTVALLLAVFTHPMISGFTYALIAPLQTALGFRHGKRRRELMEPDTQPA